MQAKHTEKEENIETTFYILTKKMIIMKTLSIFSFKMAVLMITALTLALPCMAQVSSNNSDVYLGKIQVYKFTLDSLYYDGTN